jgi:hypothetical protein
MKNRMVRKQTIGDLSASLTLIILLAALLTAAPFHAAFAQTPPPMGDTQSFAVLGGSTVTNTGSSIITGDVGVSTGSAITGLLLSPLTGPGTVIGTIHSNDALAISAQSANNLAYLNLKGRTCTSPLTGDLGLNPPLGPGVYCFTSSAQLTGTLTLDGGGTPLRCGCSR